jgi:hypothetical protein
MRPTEIPRTTFFRTAVLGIAKELIEAMKKKSANNTSGTCGRRLREAGWVLAFSIFTSRAARFATATWIAAMLTIAAAAQAQSLDGTYTGTIACGLLSHLTQPLKTKFTMTVSRDQATYERPMLRRGEPTGSFERGQGNVSPSGEVTLRGRCEGDSPCESQYSGQLNTEPVRLVGTQSWRVQKKREQRSCEIDLTRTPPSP